MILKLFLNYYYKPYLLVYKKNNIKDYSKYIEFCKLYSSV